MRFGAAGDLRDAAAVRVHGVELVRAGAVAHERDLLTVWRPGVEAVVDVAADVAGELDQAGSVGSDGEDVRGDAGEIADQEGAERRVEPRAPLSSGSIIRTIRVTPPISMCSPTSRDLET
jgi:hypothetical protein